MKSLLHYQHTFLIVFFLLAFAFTALRFLESQRENIEPPTERVVWHSETSA